MVKVSIIIPVYNSEDYIKKVFQSISSQSIDDIEVIYVNDGSTDKTNDILKKLSNKYDFIKVINQENQGSGKARNNGICKAKGEYIAFLDVDDVFIDENALEDMYNYASKNNADMVAGNLKRINNEGLIEDNFNYKQGNYTYFSELGNILPEEYGIPWAFYKNIYKKDFLIENNIYFPNLKRGQDPVFLSKVLSVINKIYTTPVNLYGYNYSSNGGADNKINSYDKKFDYIKHFKNSFDILEKSALYDNASRYKEKLYEFLQIPNNKDDKELLEIIREIFDYEHEYFNTIEEEILYLRLKLINYHDKKTLKQNILKIKQVLSQINIKNDFFINTEILKEYMDIKSKYDNLNFIIKHEKEDFDVIHDENKHLNEEILIYKDTNSNLKEENEKLMSSTSWKITRPLRMLKRQISKK